MKFYQAMKYISCIVIVVSLNHTIHAEIQSKISGGFNFASGFRMDNNTEKKSITTYNDDRGFFTDAKIYAESSYHIDDKSIVGGVIYLHTTTQAQSLSTYSHIYYISQLGKFEIGSPLNAALKMQMEALSLVKAGEAWQYFVNFPDLQYPSSLFLALPYSTLDNERINELARKLSYFTPPIANKFQFGISYIPDTGNLGSLSPSDTPSQESSDTSSARPSYISHFVKDAIAYSFSFTNEISDDINYKLILSGEYIGPSKNSEDAHSISPNKFSKFNSLNIAGILSYGPVSCAVSYSNFNHTLTALEMQANVSNAFSVNTLIAYDQGPVGASIQLRYSNYCNHAISLLSLSSDYQVLPGLKSYAELSTYDAQYTPASDIKTQKGSILVVGMKVSF